MRAARARAPQVGPRLNFSTAWSANAVSIFRSCGLAKVTRAECSRRFRLRGVDGTKFELTPAQLAIFAAEVHDRMTECVYTEPLRSFASNITPKPVMTIPVMTRGQAALESINKEMGLAFDEWDLNYYTSLFKDDLQRDPTNVELFDIAQSNSEHSRHWFFRGALTVDGKPINETLFKMVKATLDAAPHNSVIGFNDNSSAICGYEVDALWPSSPGGPSALEKTRRPLDILFTAETHNFPCAVAPYPGAETGTGGRIRDTHATGIGSIVVAATAGYCVGNLQLNGVPTHHEDEAFEYPKNLAAPLKILLDASNGASDYGNKFGEPLIQGFCRSFGLRTPDGERREWLKPIMFSGGIGQIDNRHLKKQEAEKGMLVVKLGGPAYRIGLGGGAASSMTSGSNDADLDFNAVQRGDAEMAHKLNRVVRACVELGAANPILSIHDQGAGGNCNVVKEIIYPGGGKIDIRAIQLGDETMSVLDIWGAEYQENDALLIAPSSEALLRSICARERCPISIIGAVSDTGRILLVDSAAPEGSIVAEDLELDKVLGDLPQKKYDLRRVPRRGLPFVVPENVGAEEALKRVLRLVSVGSKRFLTSKVDRSVTGLVARQQCCGPLHLPVSDVAVISQGFFGLTGAATAIGEQPIKGLLNPAAMARLTLGESLTNLVWARVSAMNDIKASGNWMYAAKLPGDGADLYDACVALRDSMIKLGVAIDGGKDSLSMAAAAGGETVKAPGELVVSLYCTCPDITLTVTPDLKLPDGVLLHVDLAAGKRRLGGSALAHAYGQIGEETPDMDNVPMFKAAFEVTQKLVQERMISSGHDISDGGLVTSLLEMAFAGNVGVTAEVPSPAAGGAMAALFAEELGLLLEVSPATEAAVLAAYNAAGVPVSRLGRVVPSGGRVNIAVGGVPAVSGHVSELRDAWEATAFELERLQASPATVAQEQKGLASRRAPTWNIPYQVAPTPELTSRHRVAVLREEGTNGDREMAAAVNAAGFEPWDVTMSDLLDGRASLDSFRGIIFAGGFSYADVLDSAKGWAGAIKFNPGLTAQFKAFYARADTFSLGVCNGCQLMALLGWVPGTGKPEEPLLATAAQPRFVHNASGRFESRFVTVRVLPGSPAIMLQGMEGLQIGVWSAHGEGQVLFPDAGVKDSIMAGAQAPIRYVDDDGAPTTVYPFNPNGSVDGIAALCSPDGRHLAMMPHPERAFLNWQLPWVPPACADALPQAAHSPWLKLFQNARVWCDTHTA
jgi:phosphoribosylformylglycinamidine synthase